MMNIRAADANAMREVGRWLATCVRAGDLLVVSGELGAGKTTLAQGIGAGMGISEPIVSPTFVIARSYRNAHGPDLVHVDAYRLGSTVELDDLDLDTEISDAVIVVEWGSGKVEQLSEHRLEVMIQRSDEIGDEVRHVDINPVGTRWNDVNWQIPPALQVVR